MQPAQASRPAVPPSQHNVRASDDDRKLVVDHLAKAVGEGHLDLAAFDARAKAAFAADTRGDLLSLLAGIPIDPGSTRSAPSSSRRYSRPRRLGAGDRFWAGSAHLLGLVTSFVGPLTVMLTKGRDSVFVRDQAREALNFQLTFLLAQLAMAVLVVITFGFGALLYLPLVAIWLVLMTVAGISSVFGQWYRYPLTLRMVT